MTTPWYGQGTDWHSPITPRLGVHSPMAEQERAQFFADLARYSGVQQQGLPYQPPQQAFSSQEIPQEQLPDANLIGRAKAWGIPEESARMLPRETLEAMVNDLDSRYRQPPEIDYLGPDIIGQMFDGADEYALGFGLGVAKGATRLLKNLPGVGEWFARQGVIQSADEWLGELETAARRVTPEELQISLSIGLGVGTAAAMWYPAIGAWKFAGVAGKVVPWGGRITSPIIRQAAQGGASAWMLEGGGEHAGLATGLGAGFGALGPAGIQLVERYGPAVAKAAERATRAFGGVWERRVSPAGMSEMLPGLPGMRARPQDVPFELDIPFAGPRQPSTADDLVRVISDPSMSTEARQTAQTLLDELSRSRLSPVVRDVADMEIRLGIQEADAMATQMSKQSLLVESSALPQVSAQTLPDETSVAFVTAIDNPGGVNIIPGIPDPAKFAETVAATGQYFRFAQRPGAKNLDAILSDEPITDDMVDSFERFGFFSGQRAMTADGVEVVVETVGPGAATVRPLYGGAARGVFLNELMPSATSPGSKEVPELWYRFQVFADNRAKAANEAVGGTLTPERVERLRDDNMPQYMEDFLNEVGIARPGERARIKQFFNERFVEGFRQFIPPELIEQNAALRRQLTALEHTIPATPLERLDAMSATKGFAVIPEGSSGRYRIIEIGDPSGRPPAQVLFNSFEEAERLVQRLHKELPDITPSTDIPLEVGGDALPTVGLQEAPSASADELLTLQIDDVREFASELQNAGDEGLAARLLADVEAAAAAGDVGRVQAAWEYGFAQAQPTRARFLEMERNTRELGGAWAEFKPFQRIYDPVQTKQTVYHREVYPWFQRAANTLVKFDRQDVRTGTVLQLWELDDPALRTAAAAAKGMTPRQAEALNEIEQFFDELGGPGTGRKIAGFLTRLRVRQSLPFDPRQLGPAQRDAFPLGPIDDALRPFAEYAEKHTLQLRQLDASVLMNAVARSIMFRRHLAPAWEAAQDVVKQLPDLPETAELRNYLNNWLDVVKYGYQPGEDRALNFLHSVVSAFVPGMTKAQVRTIFGRGITATHRALIGWTPYVLARESQQMFLAYPRTGSDLFAAMSEYLTAAPEARKLLMDRALKGGWLIPGQPRIASPGMFEEPLVYLTDDVAPVAQHAQSRRYRVLQGVVDFAYNRLPERLRHVQGTPLDPLYHYTKLTERIRLITGLGMVRRVERAIAAFRAEGPNGSLEKLVEETRASTFDESIRETFRRFIAAGDDTGAADYLARQTTHATQFLSGVSENPEMARMLGGRLGMQLGSFTPQYYQFIRESLRNGTKSDKARFIATMVGLGLAYRIARKTTGYDFTRYDSFRALTFAGGPWLTPVADAIIGGGALSQMVWQEGGTQTNTGQYQQDEAARLGNIGREALNYLNPAAGALRTFAGARQAFESPNTPAALGRLLATGERGAAPDWRKIFGQTFSQPSSMLPSVEQMQPMSGPVRGAGMGLPAPPVSAERDTNFIPAMSNPQPYQASGYTPDLVMAVVNGQSAMRQFLAPDELEVLDSMRGATRETILMVFSAYMEDKLSRQGQGGQTQPNPGGGAQF